jgi:hypothetical protein
MLVKLLYGLGVIIVSFALYKLFNYFAGKQFYEKLEQYIQKELGEKEVKLISNRVNKYPLPNNNYCWEVLVQTTIKVNQSDVSQELIDQFNKVVEKKEVDVDKVLEEYLGE